jgi:tetratricopeptide (TPR) repeat protein
MTKGADFSAPFFFARIGIPNSQMFRAAFPAVCVAVAFAQTPESPQQVLKQAIEDQQAGQLDQAIQGYELLLKAYPQIAMIHSNLGTALAAEGRYTDAIAQYEKALKLEPNPQVRLNLALSYYKLEKLDQAIATLQKVHKELPDNSQAVLLLGDCYLQLGRHKDVIALLSPTESQHENDLPFTYLLGTALVRDGQTDRGQIVIDRILRNGNSAEANFLIGTAKFMVSDFSGARDDFKKAIDLNPNLPDAYAYYGMALLSTGDQASARQAFEHEIGSNPNNFEANLHLGVLYRHDEDYEKALKYLDHALLVRPGDPGVRYQIACIKLSRNQLEQAQTDLEALVKEAPNFVEAHVTLATVYFREKRKEDGDRERAIYAKLNAARQEKVEIAAKPAQ